MLTHSSYTEYFREIARKNKKIGHSAQALHFARIILNVDEFGQDNAKEFITSLKNKIRLPFLLLVAYDHSYQDNLSDNKRKLNRGAFILLDQYTDDFDLQETRYSALEALGEEILAYMEWEFAQPPALQSRRLLLNEAGGEKIGKIDNYLGMRFSFSYSINANSALFHNPANWIE